VKLRERITISAPPDVLWPFLADPVQMSLWNDKIVAVDRDSDQPVRTGETFNMIYRMRSKESECVVTVRDVQPGAAVTYEHVAEWRGKPQIVHQTLRLKSTGNQTRVTEEIDLAKAGIPLPFRLLIWVINRFGKPTGEMPLEKLKRLVEA